MTTQPMNVLILMSDEQSWSTLGCNGNPAARTPHLDRLAESSTSFDACYTPFPLCCPSRASLWTGLMPRHHHVLGNWRAIDPALRDSSVAAAFADAGYHTMYTGKWHVPGTTPERMGFASSSAIPSTIKGRQRGRHIPEYCDYLESHGYRLHPGDVQNLTAADRKSLRDPDTPLRTTSEIPLEHFLESWQTGRFLRTFDERPADTPWLAVCSFNAPHFPMAVPAPYDRLIDRDLVELPAALAAGTAGLPREVRESRFAEEFAGLGEDDWREIIAHYLGLCALMDTQVGAILDHLRAAGELDRTIIVYTTDHGDMMGAHGLMEKGHELHYEETLRVPLLIHHPGQAAARVRNLVSMVDIAPTLAELAGVDWPGQRDGRSFATMIGDPSAAATRDHVTAETCLYGGEPEARGEHTPPSAWDPAQDTLNASVRTRDLRYIYRSRDLDELYDHRADPAEQRNLAADPAYAQVRAELRGLLGAEVGDVFPQVARELTASAGGAGAR
ncbi:sulfatase-like hydrolase/transferase [Nonomuraea sp. K274]|uniref:Sulfatase-like hydrolase/transferase n=1 Tax=Nonomuraea cypriaca TaxID=1187855 RepID=A0A931A6X8_9ACTN|nr:sulfatase-like hydrolase/transferase [Nonomuraea cypriaca]MBF8186135.1 sulfatase-like hydrolase/transferase [Nonomuraea cypriaca]